MNYKIIAVRIDKETLEQIEALIKREYPKIKTVSDVLRLSLRNFLEGVPRGHNEGECIGEV
jgi:Arc/MetJ-type ribon-helix-helix transcriptional regulator